VTPNASNQTKEFKKEIAMKQTTRHYLILALASFLTNFASQGMAQSTPQQVKGINAQGAKWQALTNLGQVAVATNATTEYVAWKVNGNENVDYSTSTDGITWTTPRSVGGTYQHKAWKAQTLGVPAITVDNNTGYVWVAWTDPTTSDLFYSTYNGVSWTYQQDVSGPGWTGQNFVNNASPAFGGGNGITMTWVGFQDELLYIFYSNWTYPGWSVPQIVSNGTWTASPDPSEFSTPNLTQSLSGPSAMYWSDPFGNIFGAAYIFGGWVGDNAIGCDSWTAQTSDNSTAAANFTLHGEANAVLFWVNTDDFFHLSYTYETFGQNGCAWADPATVAIVPESSNENPSIGPAISVGSHLSILAWPIYVGNSETKSTVWYLDPLTLPGLH
jgi:hypothetical protein